MLYSRTKHSYTIRILVMRARARAKLGQVLARTMGDDGELVWHSWGTACSLFFFFSSSFFSSSSTSPSFFGPLGFNSVHSFDHASVTVAAVVDVGWVLSSLHGVVIGCLTGCCGPPPDLFRRVYNSVGGRQ